MNTSLPPTLGTRLRQTGRDFLYLLISWPLLLAAFVVVVTFLSVGAGLILFLFGLPLIVGGAYAARFAALAERRIGPELTGIKANEPTYAAPEPSAHWLRRGLTPLADPQSWLDAAWVSVGFLFSTLTWTIAVTWLALVVGIVLGPLSLVLPGINGSYGISSLLGLPYAAVLDAIFAVLVGLGAAASASFVARGLARAQRRLANAFVSKQPEIDRLQLARSAALRAETDGLRRLERDIHDGPQQRLVRLNMDLARAKRQAASDPAKAEEIIGDAMVQAQETLAELRQLSRGIAPPVLADRGLGAALDELAARSSVPVTVYASLSPQPLHLETAAYFVASEALANVNKHSAASSADLLVAMQDDVLYIAVTDDGVGGASLAKGHGLAGLAERLRGVDGTLMVTSPVGGPTRIEAMIPCVS